MSSRNRPAPVPGRDTYRTKVPRHERPKFGAIGKEPFMSSRTFQMLARNVE